MYTVNYWWLVTGTFFTNEERSRTTLADFAPTALMFCSSQLGPTRVKRSIRFAAVRQCIFSQTRRLQNRPDARRRKSQDAPTSLHMEPAKAPVEEHRLVHVHARFHVKLGCTWVSTHPSIIPRHETRRLGLPARTADHARDG